MSDSWAHSITISLDNNSFSKVVNNRHHFIAIVSALKSDFFPTSLSCEKNIADCNANIYNYNYNYNIWQTIDY